MAAPRTPATPATLTPVAEFDGGEMGDIVGGRGPFLELIEALDAEAEVPHPLTEPRVVGISVVGRDSRAG